MNKIITVIFCFFGFFNLTSVAQQKFIKPDLADNNNFQTLNRKITLSKNTQGNAVIHLDAKAGDGVTWIKNLNFATGIIEFDVKGKDVMQESFVGVAFHGADDSTYEVVYFRPFNFQAKDTARKNHSVQYVMLPKFDWSYLRQTYPGKYEHALFSTVDPDGWLHAKITVGNDGIKVFVNNDSEPSLVVNSLNDSATGKIGFWVGNNSDGDFSNLVIRQ
jgi:hypothetical protein